MKNDKINKIDKDDNNFVNSRALFVLKIITMSFAILAFVVITTAMLTKWITDLHNQVKESQTKAAKATARIDKFRKDRIKHILRQRKLQIRAEKEDKKYGKKNKKSNSNDFNDDDMDYADDEYDAELLGGSDEESSITIGDFDNELSELMLDGLDEIDDEI